MLPHCKSIQNRDVKFVSNKHGLWIFSEPVHEDILQKHN